MTKSTNRKDFLTIMYSLCVEKVNRAQGDMPVQGNLQSPAEKCRTVRLKSPEGATRLQTGVKPPVIGIEM